MIKFFRLPLITIPILLFFFIGFGETQGPLKTTPSLRLIPSFDKESSWFVSSEDVREKKAFSDWEKTFAADENSQLYGFDVPIEIPLRRNGKPIRVLQTILIMAPNSWDSRFSHLKIVQQVAKAKLNERDILQKLKKRGYFEIPNYVSRIGLVDFEGNKTDWLYLKLYDRNGNGYLFFDPHSETFMGWIITDSSLDVVGLLNALEHSKKRQYLEKMIDHDLHSDYWEWWKASGRKDIRFVDLVDEKWQWKKNADPKKVLEPLLDFHFEIPYRVEGKPAGTIILEDVGKDQGIVFYLWKRENGKEIQGLDDWEGMTLSSDSIATVGLVDIKGNGSDQLFLESHPYEYKQDDKTITRQRFWVIDPITRFYVNVTKRSWNAGGMSDDIITEVVAGITTETWKMQAEAEFLKKVAGNRP